MKNPTPEEIAAAVVAAGATAEQGAASATTITNLMATNADKNEMLPEFNNKIEQVWNDTHDNKTLYDRFKRHTSVPTVQAVVYEKIAPVEFKFSTQAADLPDDEKCNARKIPAIHSVLKSVNIQDRFSTFGSQWEIDNIQDGQAVSIDDIIANLGASYADARTDEFEKLVDNIEPAKSGDVVNAMATLADVSKFIQLIKEYTFEFKRKRTDKYNAYKKAGDATAKADTKMYPDQRPIVFIDPKKLYQIEGDYYATLFQIAQALPDVDFVELAGMTGNKFAIMVDPRVIAWYAQKHEFKKENICGFPEGDNRWLLFSREIMGEFTCFNRMRFLTTAAARSATK